MADPWYQLMKFAVVLIFALFLLVSLVSSSSNVISRNKRRRDKKKTKLQALKQQQQQSMKTDGSNEDRNPPVIEAEVERVEVANDHIIEAVELAMVILGIIATVRTITDWQRVAEIMSERLGPNFMDVVARYANVTAGQEFVADSFDQILQAIFAQRHWIM